MIGGLRAREACGNRQCRDLGLTEGCTSSSTCGGGSVGIVTLSYVALKLVVARSGAKGLARGGLAYSRHSSFIHPYNFTRIPYRDG